VTKWIRKQVPLIRCLQETHFRDTPRLKVMGSEKISHVNRNEKKPGVVTNHTKETLKQRLQ